MEALSLLTPEREVVCARSIVSAVAAGTFSEEGLEVIDGHVHGQTLLIAGPRFTRTSRKDTRGRVVACNVANVVLCQRKRKRVTLQVNLVDMRFTKYTCNI